MYFSRWLRTDVLGCAGTLKVATLPGVRALHHANPRKGLRRNPARTPKVATLPRVQSLDHANPWEGLRVTPKSCNFASRSVARPRQSMRRVARHAEKLQLYLAFSRSTTPIHGKGCASRRRVRKKVAPLPRVRSLDHANPWERLHVTPKSCNFTSRSVARPRQSMGRVARHAESNSTSRSVVRPRQSMGRVARHAEKLQLYLAFSRSTTQIHGKGCASRRRVDKKLQLYLAFGRSTTPIHGTGYASRRKVATLPRVRSLDHANPWEGLRVAPKSSEKVAPLPRVRSLDHANPWERLHVTPKSCNFTSRSVARPRKGCASRRRVGKKLQLYLALGRSTTPIHGKGGALPRKVATLPRVQSLDHANPWYGLFAVDTLQLYLACARSSTPIHGKGCIPDRWHGAGSGFRKKDNTPRCREVGYKSGTPLMYSVYYALIDCNILYVYFSVDGICRNRQGNENKKKKKPELIVC